MCESCGCSSNKFSLDNLNHSHHGHEHSGHSHPHGEHSHGEKISLNQDILGENKVYAERNRGYFAAKNIVALNFVSSPGSGKTTILEKTITKLGSNKAFVIEGDQQTSNDAKRITQTGAKVIQINTNSSCHLDGHMVGHALHDLAPADNSLLFIENVGNLVCPALFDLGEFARVVIISVTEGDDKPLKYPYIFSSANLCLINKVDLLPYVDFSVDKAIDCARQVNPQLSFIKLSAKTEEGFDDWINWLNSCQSKK